MKIIIWGIGEYLKNRIEKIDTSDVVCYVDSSISLNEEKTFMGKPLISSYDISKYQYDFIVISSEKYFYDISSECIIRMGIPCERIIAFEYYFGKNIYKMKGIYFDCFFQARCKAGRYRVRELVDNCVQRIDLIADTEITNYGGYCFANENQDLDARIFQVTHKAFSPIKNRGYEPLGVGPDKLLYTMDSTGCSISLYNRVINECTALFWIWKNTNYEYIGLNHYRRVFASENNIGWPLQIAEAVEYLANYEIVVARPELFGELTVCEVLKSQVVNVAYERSFSVLCTIFEAKKERETFFEICEGNFIFPCNMFFAKKSLIDEYCEWLFPILFELVELVTIEKEWDEYSKRIIGFWAERLLTVWVMYKNLVVKELDILMLNNDKPYGK